MLRRRILSMALLTVASVGTTLFTLSAATAQPDVVHACTVLSKAEVKKIVPWQDFLDQMPLQEDPIAGGTGCSFPSAYVQVMTKDAAGWKRFLNAKVGAYVITIQRTLDAMQGITMDEAKPGVIELGKAYVDKLR